MRNKKKNIAYSFLDDDDSNLFKYEIECMHGFYLI